MDKKQLIGLVAATAAFITIGGANMLAHKMIADADIFSNFWTGFYSGYNGYDDYDSDYDFPEDEFIATVYVEGEILRGYSESYYDDYSSYDHQWTLDYIDDLIENSGNKGLLLYVDSPGGGVYESDQLYLKIMEYKEKTERPVWTYMASEACSGGYYVSMASDKIFCNRNGLTGSIGVVMSFQDYSKYLEEIGISEIIIASGANKTMGGGTQEMTEEQKGIFQSLVDEYYEQFVDVVALGRGMEKEKVREYADGRVYSPKQALEIGLIDAIATFEETEQAFREELEIEDVLTRQDEPSLSSQKAQVQYEGNGRLMYYAKPNF